MKKTYLTPALLIFEVSMRDTLLVGSTFSDSDADATMGFSSDADDDDVAGARGFGRVWDED